MQVQLEKKVTPRRLAVFFSSFSPFFSALGSSHGRSPREIWADVIEVPHLKRPFARKR